MKKLKFMLATAAAFGFASATQAAQFNGTTGFEEWAAGDDAIVANGIDDTGGYEGASYWLFDTTGSAVAEDNESTIKTESQSYSGDKPGSFATETKVLNVNTGKEPLQRKLASSGAAQTVDENGIYIDTLVQFTVTPANETVTVSSASDKLLIYLKEFVVDEDETVTNLCVLAGFLDVDDASAVTAKEYILDTGSITVEPNEWYRLTVKALKDIKGLNGAGGAACYPGFQIYLNGSNGTDANSCCTIANASANLIGDDTGLALLFDGAEEQTIEDIAAGKYLLSLKAELAGATATVATVGFSGEGKVDDLALGTGDPFNTAPSTVDFTFVLGTGVSAVTWTINGSTVSGLTGAVEDGDTIAVTSITYDQANWYGPAGAVSNGWTYAVSSSDISGGNFGETIEAAQLTPSDIPSATTGSDLGITDGAFSTSTGTELQQAVTWAEANSKTPSDLSAMTFSTPLSPTADELSYLLGEGTSAELSESAAVNALEITSITYDTTLGWVVNCAGTDGQGNAGDGSNVAYGHIDIFGATTVNGTYTSGQSGKSFFKAVLVK